MHAYANPAHEQTLGTELRKLLPGVEISLSHEVSPEAREFDRLCTTIANAYIQPLMKTYLSDFEARFMEQGLTCPILMMTAGGGMTTLEISRAAAYSIGGKRARRRCNFGGAHRQRNIGKKCPFF